MGKYVLVCRAPGYTRQESPILNSASVARALLPQSVGYYTARGYVATAQDRNTVALHDKAGLQFGVIRVEEIA